MGTKCIILNRNDGTWLQRNEGFVVWCKSKELAMVFYSKIKAAIEIDNIRKKGLLSERFKMNYSIYIL